MVPDVKNPGGTGTDCGRTMLADEVDGENGTVGGPNALGFCGTREGVGEDVRAWTDQSAEEMTSSAGVDGRRMLVGTAVNGFGEYPAPEELTLFIIITDVAAAIAEGDDSSSNVVVKGVRDPDSLPSELCVTSLRASDSAWPYISSMFDDEWRSYNLLLGRMGAVGNMGEMMAKSPRTSAVVGFSLRRNVLGSAECGPSLKAFREVLIDKLGAIAIEKSRIV